MMDKVCPGSRLIIAMQREALTVFRTHNVRGFDSFLCEFLGRQLVIEVMRHSIDIYKLIFLFV